MASQLFILSKGYVIKKLDRVIVCCDDKKIFDVVTKHGGEAILTSKNIKMEQKEYLK